MKALGREGKWREALAVLSQLKKDAAAAAAAATTAGNGGDGIAPNLTVYNAAVSAVSRSGKWDEVGVQIVFAGVRGVLCSSGTRKKLTPNTRIICSHQQSTPAQRDRRGGVGGV